MYSSVACATHRPRRGNAGGTQRDALPHAQISGSRHMGDARDHRSVGTCLCERRGAVGMRQRRHTAVNYTVKSICHVVESGAGAPRPSCVPAKTTRRDPDRA
eukprot:1039996-Prymnesium_polylepis.3